MSSSRVVSSEILRGGVKMTHNPLLCNTETIQWWDIVDKASNPSMLFKMDTFTRTCTYDSDHMGKNLSQIWRFESILRKKVKILLLICSLSMLMCLCFQVKRVILSVSMAHVGQQDWITARNVICLYLLNCLQPGHI